MEDQGRTQLQHADDAGRGLEVDRMAAPAVGRAPRRRRGPEPEERPHWWRTRRGRSYTLHTAEALAEDQNRRSGGTSEDWGWRDGTGGEPGPMDIEVARMRSHEPTVVRADSEPEPRCIVGGWVTTGPTDNAKRNFQRDT